VAPTAVSCVFSRKRVWYYPPGHSNTFMKTVIISLVMLTCIPPALAQATLPPVSRERSQQFVKSEDASRRVLLGAIYQQFGEGNSSGSYKVYAMREHLIVCSPHVTRTIARQIMSKIDPEVRRALWRSGVDAIDFVAAYYPATAFASAKDDQFHWHVAAYALSPPRAQASKH
jgi:hypothetical protein